MLNYTLPFAPDLLGKLEEWRKVRNMLVHHSGLDAQRDLALEMINTIDDMINTLKNLPKLKSV